MKNFLNFIIALLVVILFVGIVFSLYKIIPDNGLIDTPINPDTGNNGVDVEEIIINIKNYIF